MTDDEFIRYLAAKKSLDDRSLNAHVYARFVSELAAAGARLRVLELGGGIGTMAQRLAERGAFGSALPEYMLIDEQPHVITEARRRCAALPFEVNALAIDAREFLHTQTGVWDVLIANAFLDLFELKSIVPLALRALKPGGLFYFTINFDGVTKLLPQIDASYDEEIEALYHRTMDERVIDGVRSGDSHSGSNLFMHLRAAGAHIMASGSSDWVVCAEENEYAHDDAFFLGCILGFFEESVGARSEINASRFRTWLNARRAQVARGELIYLAHQLDFVGRAR
ncbi:MAG: class I SAM-dependent methyltransferase [Chloroflexi bacterium]|nr:class I SAM-dependent methyltransferase [Chloroflexota bacterium]